MVVGFNFYRKVVFFVQPDYPRVVLKCRYNPVLAFRDFFCCGYYGFLKKIVYLFGLSVVVKTNAAVESLVLAVLAPRLRNGLDLAVSRIPSFYLKVFLYFFHLIQRERQQAFGAYFHQFGIACPVNPYFVYFTAGFSGYFFRLGSRKVLIAIVIVLDYGVCKRFTADFLNVFFRNFAL